MFFFHNLTTKIEVINLKHLKSLTDIAHYGNDDPHCMSWQLLYQCLPSHVWQRRCFASWIQNIKLVVLTVYISPFLSQSNKTLPNTCLASEPYSLPMVSLETFQSGWFHECIMHQQKQLSLASINLALFHAAAFTFSAQKEALCVMFKPMAVPSVNVSIISEISI